MYKLLLVDDEREILDGLLEIIPFEAHGFTVVDTAQNGLEGLQKAEQHEPDLIMTDIRMPLMDGLSMLKELKTMLPSLKSMVLSGFDDFEYAQRAMSLSTARYLLKPISSKEFIKVLDEMKEELDRDHQRMRDFEKLKKLHQNSLPVLREMLLNSCINGGIGVREAMQAAEDYQMTLAAPGYALALARLSFHEDKQDKDSRHLLILAAMDVFRDALTPDFTVHIFHFDGMIALLFLLFERGEPVRDRLLAGLKKARQGVRHYLQGDAHMGLSSRGAQFQGLPMLKNQALSALEQTTLDESGKILCITDIEPGSQRAASPGEEQLRMMSNAVKMGSMADIEQALHDMFADLDSMRLNIKGYRAYLMALLTAILTVIRDMDASGDGFDAALKTLLDCPPARQAEALLVALCQKTAQEIAAKRQDAGSKIAQDAMAFIRQNFADETLSTDTLCAILHISNSYFSMVFKRETGVTFHQYVTKLRMEHAMTLLAGGDMRTSEVARAVGIPDPSYFSFVFKRYHGISPSQMKKKER